MAKFQALNKIRNLEKFPGVQFMFTKGLALSQHLGVSSVVKHPVARVGMPQPGEGLQGTGGLAPRGVHK